MNVRNRVAKVISDSLNCDPDSLKDSDNFSEDYGFDSLDHLELLLSLEEEFEAELYNKPIPDELFKDTGSLTLGKAAELVQMFLETLS